MREQQAAAGSLLRPRNWVPSQYSFPGKELLSLFQKFRKNKKLALKLKKKKQGS
jgi:hypothetical protein